jgi:hypothetical protein
MVRITLAAHPWCGEEVMVVRRHARAARPHVWVERASGEVRIVPIAWTDLEPRPAPLVADRQPICLGPREALALATWIEAQRRRDAGEAP